MALRPCLAMMGPWHNGYGLRHNNSHVEIQVTEDTDGLQFVSMPQMSNLHHTSSVTIHELSESEVLSTTVLALDTVSEELQDAQIVQVPSVVPLVPQLLDGTTGEIDAEPINTPVLSVLPAPTPGQGDHTIENSSVTSSEDHVLAPLENADVDAALTLARPSESQTGKSRKGKNQVPIDTASLRRGNRSNKYDGFRINLTNESRSHKSKVKPRALPSMLTRGRWRKNPMSTCIMLHRHPQHHF